MNKLTGPLTLWLMGLRVTDHKEKLGSCRAVTLSTSSCGEEAATLPAAVGVEEWEVGEGRVLKVKGQALDSPLSSCGFCSHYLKCHIYTARPVWLSG